MGGVSALAYIVLLLWLPISFIGVSVLRPTLACASLMIGAVMFLPNHAAFDMRGMPPIDKEAMASLGLLLACIVRYPNWLVRARPGRGLELLILFLAVAGLGTVFTNRDTLVYGSTVLPRLGNYDALSMGIRDVIRYAIPFFLGRAFFRRPSDLRDLLVVLAGAGLIYSLLILWELRMAPTLHRDVFGTASHGFAAHVRWGGYRPMVFMVSGLAIAMFVSNTVIASAALARARFTAFRFSAKLVTAYLLVILVLCKSIAAISYTVFGMPLVLFTRARFQGVEAAAEFSPERAHSLNFRFENEDQLAAKARQRPIFGWGGFRRGRVFDEFTGNDESITDGAWIILLGSRGYLGFGAIFGLLLIPVYQAGRAQRYAANERERLLLSGTALIVALGAVDLLPNGMFTNFIVYLAGCLAGAARGARLGPRRRPAAAAASIDTGHPRTRATAEGHRDSPDS